MFKKLVLLPLLGLAGLANATSTNFESLSTMWGAWKVQNNKFYSSIEEETSRFAIFAKNFKKIELFNAENDDIQFGINKFSDLTPEEFKLLHTGCGFQETDRQIIEENTLEMEAIDLPASVDWRAKGAVTPIKNQEQCGSCWAFSTTGVLEGFYFLNNGKLLSFSEQQIVSCDNKDGDMGCGGGWPYKAITYAAKTGLELESEYPYTSGNGDTGSCKLKKNDAVKIGNSGYSFVKANNANALKTAIAASPVSVLIEADQDVFQNYKSGVISKGCGASLDHAVLAVGYQKVGSQEAFIVKNSWGTDWGMDGYLYISTNGKPNGGAGVCGILSQPVIPTKSSEEIDIMSLSMI